MIIKAKKYGNSRVLPIPKAIWDLFKLTEGIKFDMQVNEDGFVFKRVIENDQVIEQALNDSVAEHSELLEILAK
jgi:antitoxin component of MazEF toxin-antitoxin module